MKNAFLAIVLLLPTLALAQPTITVRSPARHQRAAPVGSPVSITFSEAMNTATASDAALRAFGSQTGRRAGTFAGGGTANVSLQPTTAFRPGELVSVSVRTAAQNLTGVPLATPQVYQFTAAAGVGPFNFIANPPLLTGAQPHVVVAADVDNDGDLDLVIANAGGLTLTVQRNNGTGTFAAGTAVSLPGGAEALFAGDLDNDGDVDLAAALTGSGQMVVRLNDGTGVFAGGSSLPTWPTPGSQPFGISGGDLDGDGDIDLVTTAKTQSAASIFTNDGAANFTRSIATAGSAPHAVVTADLDSDGDLDLAITNATNPGLVTVRLNNGIGGFSGGSSFPVGTNPQSVVAADLDGDGDLDLATANRAGASLSVRFNDGAAGFSGTTDLPTGLNPLTLTAADLDGDGDIDLGSANQGGNSASIFRNDGAGSFAAALTVPITGQLQTWGITAGDLDGDNDIDLATVNSASARAVVLLNRVVAGPNTAPTLSSPVDQTGCAGVALAPQTLTVGDAETPVASLTLAATSSNTALLPNAAITLSGSGAARTVTLAPVAGQTGVATVTLTVTDGGGLTATRTFTLTVNAPPTVVAGPDQTVCATAAPFTLTGFSPAGGTWSGNGVDAGGTFTPSTALVGAQTLTYSATQSGCTATATKVVTVSAGFTLATAATNATSCTTPNGSIVLTTTGGTGPFAYAWSNGATTKDLTGLGAGTYSVTVTDAAGCGATANQSITAPASFTATATSTNPTGCATPNGSISVTTTGGTAPFTYLWNNGATDQNLVGLSAGTYLVTVTDAGGCTATASQTLTAPAAFTLDATAVNSTSCTAPNGSITVTTVGGTAPFSFAWSNGTTTKDLTALGAGTFTLTVTDAGGCVATLTRTLTGPPALALAATATNATCAGNDGGINLTVSGGTGPFTYLWSNGTSTKDLTALGAGTYSVTVTDAAGCSATASQAITAPASFTLNAASVNSTNCTTPNGSITVTTTGGTGPFAYSWSNGAIAKDLTALGAGTFTLTATDASGCVATLSQTITSPATFTLDATVGNNATCAPRGTIALAVTGGTGPFAYAWSNGATTQNLDSLANGAYSVTVTDASGCSATLSRTISGPTPPVVTAVANAPRAGDTLRLSATDVPGATYAWTGPNGFADAQRQPTLPNVTAAAAGVYSVTATLSGCASAAATVTVTIGAPLPSDTVRLAADRPAGGVGASVLVRVRVRDFNNILSAQGTLTWAAGVATPVGVEAFGLPGMGAANFNLSPTQVAFSWSDAALQPRTLPDSATLFAIRFTLTGAPNANAPVVFANAPVVWEVIGAGNVARPTRLQNGALRVTNAVGLGGKVLSASGKPVRGVTLRAGGATVTTAADGAYQLDVPAGQPAAVSASKNNDVVSNNGVSTLDLVLIQRHILGLTALDSPYKIIAADANASATVTTLDIVLLRALILQNTTTLPGNRLWTFVNRDFKFANPAAPFPYDSVRTYATPVAASGQDFVGIKLGDVNDSWDNTVARPAVAGQVYFDLPQLSALPGQEVRVPVRVRDFARVSGYQFTLDWSPAVLALAGVEAGGLAASYGWRHAAEGRLTTTWQDPTGQHQTLPDDSVAFTLRFRAVGALGSASPLRITSSITAREAYNADTQLLAVVAPEGRVRLGESLPASAHSNAGAVSAYPNPFTSQVSMELNLPTAEPVTVRVVNGLGQAVRTFSVAGTTGPQRLVWDGAADNKLPLPAGAYLVRVVAGQHVYHLRLMKAQ